MKLILILALCLFGNVAQATTANVYAQRWKEVKSLLESATQIAPWNELYELNNQAIAVENLVFSCSNEKALSYLKSSWRMKFFCKEAFAEMQSLRGNLDSLLNSSLVWVYFGNGDDVERLEKIRAQNLFHPLLADMILAQLSLLPKILAKPELGASLYQPFRNNLVLAQLLPRSRVSKCVYAGYQPAHAVVFTDWVGRQSWRLFMGVPRELMSFACFPESETAPLPSDEEAFSFYESFSSSWE